MIGILCAMQEEVDGFLSLAQASASDHDRFTPIRIGGFDAMLACCGLGKVNAAMTASVLLERFNCRGLVSAGTAGGLGGSYAMQVIVGTELVQHDYGRSRGAGLLELYRPGVPPLPAYLSEDFSLRLSAERKRRFVTAAGEIDFIRFGTFASGDTFVNDPQTRKRLVDLGAIAVDMESAAVAQVAEYHGLPWLVAKGISDDASHASHEAFLEGLVAASRRSAEAVRALLPAIDT